MQTLPQAVALTAKIDAAEGFMKYEYRSHVDAALEAPTAPAAAFATHNPAYALMGGAPPPTAAAVLAPKPGKALPRKWTLKWPAGFAPEGPPPVVCASCHIIHELYEVLEAAVAEPADLAAVAKVAKCKERTTLYMGHLMRCCVQQHYINQLIASVAANPTHVHVVFDYKVLSV